MYQEQYNNIKYSDFINEFNQFISPNLKITNINQSKIKNQLLYFNNLCLIKGIPASYKLLQTNFLNYITISQIQFKNY